MGMTVFGCCYKCPDRTIECHATCEKYKAECIENERIKELRRQNAPANISQGSFIGNAISSHRHRRDK